MQERLEDKRKGEAFVKREKLGKRETSVIREEREERLRRELFARMMEQVQPDEQAKERIWSRVEETRPPKGFAAVRPVAAAVCALVICVLGVAGANAATDGAIVESVKRFCGLTEQQQEVAEETIFLPNEVYASNLVACSDSYIVFANERGMMIYDRVQGRLAEALDLQAIDCNYFNAETVVTHIYRKEEKLYIFNQKMMDPPARNSYYGKPVDYAPPKRAYVYDMSRLGEEDALEEVEDETLLADILAGWEDYRAACVRDTFDEMQGRPLDINEMFGNGEYNYSQDCIIWEDGAGEKKISFLLVSADNEYTFCTRPLDGEELQQDTLAMQTAPADEGAMDQKEKLPAFRYSGEDDILRCVCEEALKESERYALEENGVMIPGPVILATVEDGDDVYVFCDLQIYGYYRNGNTLNCESGGSFPSRLRLSPTADGWTVTERVEAGDGADYLEGIKRFCDGFPVSHEIYFYDVNKREQIRRELIGMYVSDNHLDIRYYKDFGWDPVAIYE